MPIYVQVATEYENAAKRATNSRTLSSLHGKESWNPLGRILTIKERELLIGPLESVTYYNRLTVCDKITNRLIEYSCTSLSKFPDHVGKQTSSFVSILSHSSDKPQFGCIVSLFSHVFVQETSYWAIVEQFTMSEYDDDVKMWHVAICGSQ